MMSSPGKQHPLYAVARRAFIFLVFAAGVALMQVQAQADAATASDTSLTVAQTAEVNTFDPTDTRGIDAIAAISHLYDRLVFLGPDGGVSPWLAEEWDVSEDGRTWTFYLRQDAFFPDGSPVNSEAVAYSLLRAAGEGAPPSLARTYLREIESVETPDEYTVRVITPEPYGPILGGLGHPTTGAILNPRVVDEHGGDFSGALDAGSGPYRIVEWRRNEHLILERYDDWWGPQPYFERIIYMPVTDPATRVIMLERGEADLATILPVFDIDRLQQNANLTVIETESVRAMYFAFNWDREPTDDVRVRQAFNYAVDVEGIVDALMGGHGERARSIVAPQVDFSHPTYDFEFDPDRARHLLEEAGVAEGTRIIVHSTQGRYPMDGEVATAVAGDLSNLGMDVEIQLFGDFPSYVQSRPDGSFHLTLFAWAPGNLDPDGVVRGTLHSTSTNNLGGYNSSRADELIDAAAQSVDPQVRYERYRELQELLADDVPQLLLHTGVSFSGIRADVCGVSVRSDEAHFLWAAERC